MLNNNNNRYVKVGWVLMKVILEIREDCFLMIITFFSQFNTNLSSFLPNPNDRQRQVQKMVVGGTFSSRELTL